MRETHEEARDEAEAEAETGATTPPPLKMTPGTKGLVAANVAIWGVMVVSGVPLLGPEPTVMLEWGGGLAPLTLGAEPWRLLTAMFLHYGVLHVGVNMLVLAQAGVLAERLVGTAYFIASYLVAGLGGALASALFNATAVSAGASGAVFGVYGLLLGWVLRHRGLIPDAAVKQTMKMAGAFFLYNLPFGLVPNVDMAAHVGGALSGFLCGLLVPGAAHIMPLSLGRSVATLALGAAASIGAAIAVPAPPIPTFAVPEFQSFVIAEKEVLTRYNQQMATVMRSPGMESAHTALAADEARLTAAIEQLDQAKAPGAQYAAAFQAYATEVVPIQVERIKALQSAGDTFHALQAYVDYVEARASAALAIAKGYTLGETEALQRAFADWRGAVSRLQEAGAASDRKTIEVLESEIVPRWREQLQAFEALQTRKPPVAKLDALLPYVQTRMGGFETLLEGLKKQDPAMVAEGYRLQAEAGEMAAALTAGD